MNVTIPITISKAVAPPELSSIEVDGYQLLGYILNGTRYIYTLGAGDNKKYIDPDGNTIGVFVSETVHGSYTANVTNNFTVDASEISENPYEEDDLTLNCSVTGTDPETGLLICNIELWTTSDNGNFRAEGLHCSEDAESIIDLGSFVPL